MCGRDVFVGVGGCARVCACAHVCVSHKWLWSNFGQLAASQVGGLPSGATPRQARQAKLAIAAAGNVSTRTGRLSPSLPAAAHPPCTRAVVEPVGRVERDARHPAQALPRRLLPQGAVHPQVQHRRRPHCAWRGPDRSVRTSLTAKQTRPGQRCRRQVQGWGCARSLLAATCAG